MAPRTKTLLIGATVAAVLFLAMVLLTWTAAPWQASATPDAGAQANATAEANDLGGITGSLFGPNVIAFEVLGVLLTAAMIGALVIARPLHARDDEDRYSQPTQAQEDESDAVSDPKQHPTEGEP